jgi:hypothetical protein
VLLQSGTHDAMAAAGRSATDALQVARAALSARDPSGGWLALETGSGLVLHAATVASTVPELLRGADEIDLAEQWNADPPAADGARWRTDTPAMPNDARFRALGHARKLHGCSSTVMSAVRVLLHGCFVSWWGG